jgi:hypothetical protein
MIDNAKALQLDRGQGLSPIPFEHGAQFQGVEHVNIGTSYAQDSVQGMSPKKLREVSTMTAHIMDLLQTLPALKGVRHVVDIGAGQVNASRLPRLPFLKR